MNPNTPPHPRSPFQETPLARICAVMVGGVWAFCGFAAIPQLLAQPQQFDLVLAYELALTAAAMGMSLLIWGLWTPHWIKRFGEWAGSHCAFLLLLLALPPILHFMLTAIF